VLRLAAAGTRSSFVMSDHTFRPEIGIGPDSPFYRYWQRADARAWQRLLADHHDGIFARLHAESRERDPPTLSAVFGEPFVAFTDAAPASHHKGRMWPKPDCYPVRLSQSVDDDSFLRWLDHWSAQLPQWIRGWADCRRLDQLSGFRFSQDPIVHAQRDGRS
jgi:hypothetical protein